MKKLFDARLYVYSIGLIISSTIERGVTTFINKNIELESISYHTLSLFILIILFILTNILLKPLTQKEFITKMVLGKNYVGGLWLEIVITENKEISHITKMNISYDSNEIKIHGDCFKNFQYAYSFDSICSKMEIEKYQLTYYFIAEEGVNNTRKDVGYLRFDPSTMKTYSGHFEDKDMKFKVAANLIKNKKVIKKMANNLEKTFNYEILPDIIEKHGLTDIKIKKIESPIEQEKVHENEQISLSTINN